MDGNLCSEEGEIAGNLNLFRKERGEGEQTVSDMTKVVRVVVMGVLVAVVANGCIGGG